MNYPSAVRGINFNAEKLLPVPTYTDAKRTCTFLNMCVLAFCHFITFERIIEFSNFAGTTRWPLTSPAGWSRTSPFPRTQTNLVLVIWGPGIPFWKSIDKPPSNKVVFIFGLQLTTGGGVVSPLFGVGKLLPLLRLDGLRDGASHC